MSTMAADTASRGAPALAHPRWRAPSREARDTLFMVALMVPPSPSRKMLKEVDEFARTFIADGLGYHPR